MLVAKMTDKGQLVIPKSIRDALRLGGGSELLVSLEAGRVVLEPRRSKSGTRLGEWLFAMQVRPASRNVDLSADVDGYSES
jgi:AbrB family looped-hinge helix DNA binding protein